ncbi:outer membrane protein assembly factor BamC [Shewanella maritima]|uniref:outer membrane protein assembly factor BamC n=1 Tax=Shewanella maritima TaxID=2520507 RepID=UPI003735FB8C
MLKKVSPLLVILAVSACSTPTERRQVNGSEEYVNTTTTELLAIPEGLNEPRYSREYEVPEVGAETDKTYVGKKLDIRPPLQVLPMAEGTRVEEGSDNIKIVVESIDNNTNLKQEISDSVVRFLNRQNYPIRLQDFDAGIIETDVIESTEVIEKSFWGSDKTYVLQQRYKFTIDVQPHGRTGNLMIDLIEHEEIFDDENQDIMLSDNDKRRYTIDMLNNAIAYVSVSREKALREARIQRSLGIKLSLVHATDDEGTHWVAEAPFDNAWDRLRLVLPEMGLDIIDMDKNKGLYYVNLDNSGGFWSSLWDDKSLNLKEGSYRVILEDTADKQHTNIYFRNVDDEAIDDQVIADVYDRISELMETDRKVK